MFKPPSGPPKPLNYFHDCFMNRNLISLSPLLHHQQDAIQSLVDNYSSTEPVNPALVVLPTGCGKTAIVACAPFVLPATNHVLVLCPSLEIFKQTVKELSGTHKDPRSSFIASKGILVLPKERPPVVTPILEASELTAKSVNHGYVVANVHKFRGEQWKQLEKGSFDTVIVDEAHHLPSAQWQNVVDHFKSSARVIFLTATPYRSDGKELLETVRVSDHIVYNLSLKDAMSKNLMKTLDLEPKCPATEEAMVLAVVEQLRLQQKTVPQFDHQAMVAARRCEDADRIAQLFRQNNCPAASYFRVKAERKPATESPEGEQERKKRRRLEKGKKTQALSDFKSGKLKVLVIVGCLLEGFDHPPVSVVAVMAPVTSAVKFAQFVGRALRIVRDPQSREPVTVPQHAVVLISQQRCAQHRHLFDQFILEHLIPVTESDDEEPGPAPAPAPVIAQQQSAEQIDRPDNILQTLVREGFPPALVEKARQQMDAQMSLDAVRNWCIAHRSLFGNTNP